MKTLGQQYKPDDTFRRIARKHQSLCRSKILKVPCDKYGSMLTREDAERGLNFYHDYGVFEAVTERYPKYKKQLYANMLRSEHIPFNFFVPFRTEKALFCSTAASVLGVSPAKIISILIEHAPPPGVKYLKDRTSFDVFCECEDHRGDVFFMGIEIKYTEREYKIGQKEQRYCQDPHSPYNSISRQSGLYIPKALDTLKTDRFRQTWRNHLLAEATFQNSNKNYKYYKSIILYPSGNTHMNSMAREYRRFLSKDREDIFLGGTFEQFFFAIDLHVSSSRAKEWVEYLKRRYIPVVETSHSRHRE